MIKVLIRFKLSDLAIAGHSVVPLPVPCVNLRSVLCEIVAVNLTVFESVSFKLYLVLNVIVHLFLGVGLGSLCHL